MKTEITVTLGDLYDKLQEEGLYDKLMRMAGYEQMQRVSKSSPVPPYVFDNALAELARLRELPFTLVDADEDWPDTYFPEEDE